MFQALGPVLSLQIVLPESWDGVERRPLSPRWPGPGAREASNSFPPPPRRVVAVGLPHYTQMFLVIILGTDFIYEALLRMWSLVEGARAPLKGGHFPLRRPGYVWSCLVPGPTLGY